MDRQTVKALHNDLTKAVEEVAKKYHLKSTGTNNLTFRPDFTRFTAGIRLEVQIGKNDYTFRPNLPMPYPSEVGYSGERPAFTSGQKITFPRNGKLAEMKFIEWTHRGSAIVEFNGQRGRIGPFQVPMLKPAVTEMVARVLAVENGQPLLPPGILLDVKKKFIELILRSEPERLTCDGEIRQRWIIEKKKSQIRKEWKVLENRLHRSVSHDEVGNWIAEGVR